MLSSPRAKIQLSITKQHTQETLCLAHIYAIAGMAGVNYSIKYVYDYGVDGQFSEVVQRGNRLVNTGYPLDFQAKASTNWELSDGNIIYDLEAKTYNDIVSRTSAETTLILILLCLPPAMRDWHGTTYEQTTLRHCCYWQGFTGAATQNTSKQRVSIPTTNLLTPEALRYLLAVERARRQGQVS